MTALYAALVVVGFACAAALLLTLIAPGVWPVWWLGAAVASAYALLGPDRT